MSFICCFSFLYWFVTRMRFGCWIYCHMTESYNYKWTSWVSYNIVTQYGLKLGFDQVRLHLVFRFNPSLSTATFCKISSPASWSLFCILEAKLNEIHSGTLQMYSQVIQAKCLLLEPLKCFTALCIAHSW